MNPSRPFILRPIATSLLMLGLMLIGLLAFKELPVSALPEVDYPTIEVMTFYPGASPDVMATAVTAPLERQFGQLPGLNQMTSSSSDGSSVITLQFVLDLNIDVAEQQVQAAMNAATTYLPADLPNPPIYSKTNPADAPILTLALTSQTLSLPKVEDFADTRLAQKISQLPGRGPGEHQRRPEAGGAGAGESRGPVHLRPDPGGRALGGRRTPTSTRPKATSTARSRPPHRRQRPAAHQRRIPQPLVVAYRNGTPVRCPTWPTVVDDAENVKQAAWMNTPRR